MAITADTSTSGHVAVGGSVNSNLGVAGESDWFSISLTAGQSYSFQLNSGSSGGLIDPYLELHDASGSLLDQDDDSGGGLNSLLTYTATQSGKYFLAASSGTTGPGTGNYVLSATLIKDDFAGNTSTTGHVDVGGSATGNLEIIGDNDWFAITLVAGQNYTFTLNSGSSGGLDDPYLTLYDANGNILAQDDDGGDGLNSLLTYAATHSGKYFLGASSGTTGAGTGTYVVSATAITDDYAGNTTTTGTVIVGGSTTGNLEFVNDTDWFAITLTAGQSYTFKLDSGSSGGLDDPYLTLYDANGNVLAQDDDGGSGLNSLLTYTVTHSGKYYLAASSGTTGAGTGTYLLSADTAAATDTIQSADSYTLADTTTSLVLTGTKDISGTGNSLDNTITGNAGNNVLTGGAGNDTIDGGGGTDTAVFSGNLANYTLTKTDSNFFVQDNAGTDGTDSLANIQRLQFSDTKLAIDMDVTQSGGEVALLIGAVLGKASLTAKALVGQLLPFFDAGYTLHDAANTLVNAGIMDQLAGGSSTNAFVNLIFHSVIGQDATPDVTAQLASYIDGGGYTKADFLAIVAALPLNQANVDLVGLHQSGLAYS